MEEGEEDDLFSFEDDQISFSFLILFALLLKIETFLLLLLLPLSESILVVCGATDL